MSECAFAVKIFNDPWFEDEAGCILLSTCSVESTLMPALRSTIVDEAVTPWQCVIRAG